MWMLETEEGAHARGIEPLYEIGGFGGAFGSAAAAMAEALAMTGIEASAIACIIASANGSPAGDEMEARALRTVFGDRLGDIPVCAPKAAVGEAMGASGAMCAAVAGLALQKQQVPPTAGFTETETGLKLSAEPQPFSGEYALINAIGCEGNNAALVIRKWTN
jgi:3-oxoacyl-[acyl-carrier-protein] synthase II